MNSAVYIGGVLGGQNQQVDPQRPLIHLTVGPATLRIEGKMTQRQMSMLADFVKDIRYSDVCVQREEEERPNIKVTNVTGETVVEQGKARILDVLEGKPAVFDAPDIDCQTIEPQF